jgi:hypothetical protein
VSASLCTAFGGFRGRLLTRHTRLRPSASLQRQLVRVTSHRALEVSICFSGAVGLGDDCCPMSIVAGGFALRCSWCEEMNMLDTQLQQPFMSANVNKALRCNVNYLHATRRRRVISSTSVERRRGQLENSSSLPLYARMLH